MFTYIQYTYNNHPFSIRKLFVLQTWKYASVPQQEFSAACESGETSGLDGEVSGDDDHDSDNTMIHIMKSEILGGRQKLPSGFFPLRENPPTSLSFCKNILKDKSPKIFLKNGSKRVKIGVFWPKIAVFSGFFP